MPYFKIINILLIHIPKTGGTSIENYFYNNYKIKRTINTFFSYNNLTLNKHSLQHSTYLEFYEHKDYFEIDFDKSKIITVVRNPYDRIISDLFFYKLITIDFDKNKINNIINYFLESNDIVYDNHKMEQYKYLIDSNGNINKDIIIMKTETLNNDMINNGFLDFNLNENVTHRNNLNYISLLNDESIKLINDYYKKDFEYFNYEMIIV